MDPQRHYLESFRNQEGLRKNWIWFLILGIILIILGVIAIGHSVYTTVASIVFLGVLLIISGALQTIYSFWAHRWSGFFLSLLTGVLYLVVGSLFVSKPLSGALVFTLLLGAFYLVGGIFRIIGSIMTRFDHWGWSLFSGIITLLLGVLILAGWPETGLWVIGLFIGIDLIIFGWVWVALSLAAKSHHETLIK